MIRLDALTHEEYVHYHYAVRQPQLIRYNITVLDEDESELGSLTLPHNSRLLSGQRDIDTTQVPSRSLTIDCLDRHGEIALHPNHPSEAGIFLNRFVAVRRGIYVGGLQRWIDVPIFTGPVTGFTRDQEQVHLTAKGMEVLFVAPHLMWRVMSFKKGEKITDVMKAILKAKGETDFSEFPEMTQPLPKHLSVTRHQEAWPVLQRLAHALNRQLFYDGRGHPKLRQHPQNPLWTFHSGENGTLVTRPGFTFDHESIRNLVEVLGPKPSGKKQKRIRAIARLPEDHPMSPESLAWNGVPRFMIESVDIDAPSPADKSDKPEKKAKIHEALIHRQKYAEELAARRLKELSRDSLTATADVVPMSDLEELDIYQLEWEGDVFDAALKQSTLPFHSENMTLGYLKRVPVYRRRRRGPQP